eukprot:3622463-Amphidinium_carterae.1
MSFSKLNLFVSLANARPKQEEEMNGTRVMACMVSTWASLCGPLSHEWCPKWPSALLREH